MTLIQELDFIGIPSQDAARARSFYRDVLGMRPDEHAEYEQWAGSTCFVVWEPERVGMDCFFIGCLRGTEHPVWQLTAIDVLLLRLGRARHLPHRPRHRRADLAARSAGSQGLQAVGRHRPDRVDSDSEKVNLRWTQRLQFRRILLGCRS